MPLLSFNIAGAGVSQSSFWVLLTLCLFCFWFKVGVEFVWSYLFHCLVCNYLLFEGFYSVGFLEMGTNSKFYVTEIIPIPTKIIEHKLKGPNYLEWSRKIRVYL